MADARCPVPAHIPDAVVRDFDWDRDPRIHARPFESCDEARDLRAFWSPFRPVVDEEPGYWILTRAEDARYVLQHPEEFSSVHPHPEGNRPVLIPLELDPPDHTVFRHLLAPRFTPGSAERMRPEVEAWCAQLLDRVADGPGCEFLDAFAKPFPTGIFCNLMGIPFERVEDFLRWNHGLIHETDMEVRAAAQVACVTYLSQVLAERRASPQDDLLSLLATASIDGAPLDDAVAINIAVLLFMAGLDTVTASLSWIFLRLATHPEEQAQLRANPELVPGAVEELLRMHAIVSPPRFAARDMDFAGVHMKQGDLLLVVLAMATRDPAEFPDPTSVAFDRPASSRHLAFGGGPHRCIGSHLAREELVIAVRQILQRLPAFRLVPGADLQPHAGAVIGLGRLPLEWSGPEGAGQRTGRSSPG